MEMLWLLSALPFLCIVLFVDKKEPMEKILWLVTLLCLPWWGIFLYICFGSTLNLRVVRTLRARRLRDLPVEPDEGEPLSAPPETRRLADACERLNAGPLTTYDTSLVLTDGEAHMDALLRDVRSAKESVFMEYYAIETGEQGERLVAALAERARRGVHVLVLIDFCANILHPPSLFAPLIRAGGRLKRVKPYATHFRSHRKIVVIDRRIAYIGGMNIGQKYMGLVPPKTPWRDTQVRLTGACVGQLERYFLLDWCCALSRTEMRLTRKLLPREAAKPREPGAGLCQFIAGGADNDDEYLKLCYLQLIRSARQEIRIQSPYFIPDGETLGALKAALVAGVRVRLMIPGASASFYLDPTTRYYLGQLLPYGAEILRYRGYIHAKTLSVDDTVTVIGSLNMDMRSLQVDDEICGLFYSPEFTAKEKERFEQDAARCDPLTAEEFQTRSRARRAAEHVFHLFAPWF